MTEMPESLLALDEPAPVTVRNENGASPFLIVADHAGNLTPRALGKLGVSDAEWQRHIGWDIGIAGVCRAIADKLGATIIQQNYSRLIVDCNRTPGTATSMPEVSEATAVPGNVGLSEAQKAARVAEIFSPYHDRIEAELDRRRAEGRPTALIAMHSFTPVFKGESRAMQVGVLYNRDVRLAAIMLELLRAEGDLTVGDNAPYAVSDITDYGVPMHAERRGLAHVEIEIRQDLIADAAGQATWAARFERLLSAAVARL